ncbi:MAG TPA: SpoIIE family protein phosphatase [Alphaproteobacteria bacterium]|nr:SpoIIE family protein phosphatase [Alphaproteobacteria bacterium]
MCALFNAAKSAPNPAQTTLSPALDLQQAQLAAASYGRPSGGDLHDYFRINESRALFALLDIAGSLDQNRAIIEAAQSTLRSSGVQLLAQEDVNEADAMIEVCVQMNRAILQAAERVFPCPVFAGCYNETLGTVCYVNAGHTPGLLRDSTGIAELGATGLPLGLFSHSAADASIVAVEAGAALLVVSRGLVEARHKKTEFGLPQVKEILLRTPGQSAQEVCAALLEKVQEFMAGTPAPNDVTAICLARSSAVRAF